MNPVSTAMYVIGEEPDINPLLRSTSETPTETIAKTANSSSFFTRLTVDGKC